MQEMLQLWCKSKGIEYHYDICFDIHYFRRFITYDTFTKGSQFTLHGCEIREITFGDIEYLLNSILNKLGVN